MSRKGDCWDNAVAKSFFKTLKVELIYQNSYKTFKEAELSVFEYIEAWYNVNRILTTIKTSIKNKKRDINKSISSQIKCSENYCRFSKDKKLNNFFYLTFTSF
jgi:hypothetical protein